MPLNIFEPRYLQMVDEAIAGARLIGMIQPGLDGALRDDGEPELCNVGCIGRITSLSETRRRPLSDFAAGRLPVPRRRRNWR